MELCLPPGSTLTLSSPRRGRIEGRPAQGQSKERIEGPGVDP